MTQTRISSGLEALLNVVLGYGLAIAAQFAVFPVFGLEVTLPQSLGIGAVFTGLSLVRSSLLRRLFVRLGDKGDGATAMPRRSQPRLCRAREPRGGEVISLEGAARDRVGEAFFAMREIGRGVSPGARLAMSRKTRDLAAADAEMALKPVDQLEG